MPGWNRTGALGYKGQPGVIFAALQWQPLFSRSRAKFAGAGHLGAE